MKNTKNRLEQIQSYLLILIVLASLLSFGSVQAAPAADDPLPTETVVSIEATTEPTPTVVEPMPTVVEPTPVVVEPTPVVVEPTPTAILVPIEEPQPPQISWKVESRMATENFGGAAAPSTSDQGTLDELRWVLYDAGGPVKNLLGGPVSLIIKGQVIKGEELQLTIESNPSTGASWQISGMDATILEQAGDTYFTGGIRGRLGAAQHQVISLKAVSDGNSVVELIYRRPWDADFKPGRSVVIETPHLKDILNLTNPKTYDSLQMSEAEGMVNPPLAAANLALPPSSFDWRTSGKVSSVKDQGWCGSCWAFSAVGTTESALMVQRGLPVMDLSEQYLVSCNIDDMTPTCDVGGDNSYAMDYHKVNGYKASNQTQSGAVLESNFPYAEYFNQYDPVQPCSSNYTKSYWLQQSARDSWYVAGNWWTMPTVDQIKNAIYTYGPISAAVCAGTAFQSYTSGIFTTNEGSQCTYANHAIMLVGWNDADNTWIMKNSWGTGWGESGYMRIQRGISHMGIESVYVPAPSAIALAPSAVAQGAVANTVVGTLTTTGGTAPYTYSLANNATGGMGICTTGVDDVNNDMFKIGGGSNNQILVNTTVTSGIKKICVRATDSALPAAYYTKAITVTVNPSPTNIVLAPSAVAQGTVANIVVGTLTTTGGTPPYTYLLVTAAGTGGGTCAAGDADDNTKFQVGLSSANLNKIYTKEAVTTGDKKICVQATDSAVPKADYTKNIVITFNPSPTIVALAPSAVAQGTLANTVVGTLTTTGGTAPYTYSLVTSVGTGGGTCAASDFANNTMFKIGTLTNLGKILTNATVTTVDKKICVRATDSAVPAANYTKNIVIAVNNPPTNITLAPSAISEGAAANAVVGTLTTTDLESGTETYTYSLVTNTTGGTGTCATSDSANNAMFKIGGASSNQILVNTTVTAGAKKICVRSTDNGVGSLYYTKNLTITVNAAPTNVALAPSGAIVGTLTDILVGMLTTTGGTSPITYTLVDDAGAGGTGVCVTGIDNANNALFKVGAGVDANKILTNATVTTGPKKICVRATDSATPAAYYTKALTITANNTPTDITLSTSTVIQNSPLNTQVATLTTTDVDPADTFTYSLVTDVGTCGGDGGVAGNAFFKIGTGANADKLLVNTPPTSGNKDICLRSTDNGIPNAYYTKAITIIVTPVWSLSGTVSFTACPTLKLGGGLVATFGAKTGAVNFVDGTYSIDNVVDHAAGTVTITQPSDGYTFSAGIPITDVDSDKTGNNFTAVGTRTISGTFTGPAAYGSPRVPADGATGATVTLANCVIFSVPANGTSATTAFTISGLPAKAFVLHPLYGKGALVANPIATPFTPANLYGNTTYGNIAGKAFTFTWNNFTIGGSAKNNYGANLTGATTVTLVGTGEFAGVNSTGTAATAGLWSAFSPFRKPASGVNDPQPYTANIIFANPNYQDFVLGTSNPQTFDNNKTNNVTGYGSAAIFGTIGGYLPEGTVVNFGGGLISNIEDAGQFLISELEPKSYTLLPTATGIYFTNSATTYTAATSRSILATAAGAELNMWYGWDLANLPYPTAPANNAIVPLADPKSPTFNWTAVTGATSYDVQVSTTSTFTAATTKTVRVTGELTYTPATGDIYNLITSGVKVYWGVKANGGAPGTSIYTHLVPGGVRAFTTNNLPPTIGLLTFAGNVATFNWTASQNAIATNKYMVEYNNSPTLAGTTTKLYAVFPAVIANTTIVTPPAKTYYFRVTLLNAANVPISVASAISVGVLH